MTDAVNFRSRFGAERAGEGAYCERGTEECARSDAEQCREQHFRLRTQESIPFFASSRFVRMSLKLVHGVRLAARITASRPAQRLLVSPRRFPSLPIYSETQLTALFRLPRTLATFLRHLHDCHLILFRPPRDSSAIRPRRRNRRSPVGRSQSRCRGIQQVYSDQGDRYRPLQSRCSPISILKPSPRHRFFPQITRPLRPFPLFDNGRTTLLPPYTSPTSPRRHPHESRSSVHSLRPSPTGSRITSSTIRVRDLTGFRRDLL